MSNRMLSPSLIIFMISIVMLASGPLEVVAQTPAPEKHTVQADGHPMAVWSKVPVNPTKVVLLLHGRTWSTIPDFDLRVPGEKLSLMDALYEQGYAVYGLDLCGYGGTPRDATGWLTPERASSDVTIVLQWVIGRHQNMNKPVLFGWSYGCLSAQMAVQNHPGLVSGIVFFGYPGTPNGPWYVYEDPAEPDRMTNTAEAAASDFMIPGSISQKAIDAYVKAALKADPVRVDWRKLYEFDRLDPEKVTKPTLLMQGEYDPVVERYAHTDLFNRLGTGHRQWVVIPGGDHAAFMETPRPLFLNALFGFIDGLGALGGK